MSGEASAAITPSQGVCGLKVCTRLLFLLIPLVCVALGPAHAVVFDTNDHVYAGAANYWPWGDNRNTRYQLWFDSDMLAGYGGLYVTDITHFAYSGTRDASWTLEVYASNTSVNTGGLSADDPDSNHGADKTLIFDGTVSMLGTDTTLSIDVDDSFTYDGSSNLLLDYIFSDFEGVGSYYDGPTWEAVGDTGQSNDYLWRVTNHTYEGNIVYGWGAIRTELGMAPGLPAFALIGVAPLAAGLVRRFRRR